MKEDRALELIGRFYDAVLQPALWHGVARELADAFGAAAGGIHIRTLAPMERAQQMWAGLDPAFEDAYLQHYFAEDPWAAFVNRVAPGQCIASGHLLSERDLVRTAFYNDLCRPFGLHDFTGGVVLHEPGSYWISVGLLGHINGARFDDHHLTDLRNLMPHLRRALEISRRVLELQHEITIAGDALDQLSFGVIAVDEAGRVVRANRAAERILSRKDGLSVDARGLVALELRARAELRAALEQAIKGGLGDAAKPNFVRVPRAPRAQPLALVLAPVNAGAWTLGERRARCVVYVIDPESTVAPPEDVLRRVFKLTPAEARLALLVGQGKVPKEAASELSISWNTARFQLRQVFAKTGTDRQAALVRLLSSFGWVGNDLPEQPARLAGHPS
jgi:DNA-binding CsgD family transcriptional regulator